MNTPDTEKAELAVFWDEIVQHLPKSIERSALGDEKIFCAFATAYPKMKKHLVTSRDTYWKERVEETRTKLLFVGEKVLKEMSEIYAVDIKYADKKQWLEPSEFERIFLHRFNEAGLKALDTLLDNLK